MVGSILIYRTPLKYQTYKTIFTFKFPTANIIKKFKIQLFNREN